jgi:hypothetical protein
MDKKEELSEKSMIESNESSLPISLNSCILTQIAEESILSSIQLSPHKSFPKSDESSKNSLISG